MIGSSDYFTNEEIHRAANLIRDSQRMVALTGAGISTPSGIPDFRSQGSGLWTRYLPMEVASLSTFRHNPELFYAWLHPLVSHMLSALPNPAHLALAELERAGYLKTIITQNIDGLLHRSGARNILEVHGTLNTLSCGDCYRQYSSQGIIEDYLNCMSIPHCPDCNGILKPDIILYEEQLPINTWRLAVEASKSCDLMLVAGTSLEVLPSAGLPLNALEGGAHLMVVNKTATYIDVRADLIIRGDVADILPRIVGEVLNG
jgi:NAD-dependent deacetylase